MRQIAQELGVSTGTLYHYFPSKEALFLQLVLEQTQEDTLNFQSATKDVGTLSERIATLMKFVDYNKDYFCQQILIWIDFYRTKEPQEFLENEILKQANKKVREVVRDYLHLEDQTVVDLGETISFSEQGILLKNMITSYLEQKQNGRNSHEN